MWQAAGGPLSRLHLDGDIMCLSTLLSLLRPTLPGKGLAMATYRPADLDALRIDADRDGFWYVWGWRNETDPRYIPMVRDWLPVADKTPPRYLLLGNEPNAEEPYGSTFHPDGAAWWCKAFELQYPGTVMVVGNVSADDWFGGGCDGVWWLTQFLRTYQELWDRPFSGVLGCHLYIDDNLDYAKYEMQRYATLLDDWDGELWLTEFAMAVDPAQPKLFKKALLMARDYFTRIAVYTNEQDGGPSSLPFDVDLVPGGVLSEIGEVYARF